MSTKKSTVDSPTNNFSDLTSETRGYEAVTVKSTRFTRYKHTPIHENMASNYRKLPTNNGLNETNLYSNRCGVNNLNFVLFKFSRRNSLRNATLIFLILLIGKGNAKAARNKIPLIQTDASQEPGYITSQDEVRLRETISNSVSMDDIDFQSANYIDHWGDDVTDVLLVAGRNHVYMINNTLPMDEPNIKFIEILTWISSEDLIRDCQMMGKKPEECQNFIRVVERKDNQTLFVCGTNAYTPTCRTYLRSNFNSANENSISETEQKCRGKECPVPYNPKTQSVTLYTNTASGKQLFSALLHDFYGTEPVILKRKLSTATASITTEPKWLYKPTFIKMVEYGEKVYLFFREIAQESETRNGEEMVYSRVAQICKDDLGGGEEVLYQKWTTFLKARISCNNSNSPNSLQFNNLTAVSDIKYVTIDGQSKAVVFATFTTPWDWQDVSVSSVCMYSLQDDIQQVFDTASFLKEYKLTTSTDDLTLRYLETTKKESRAIDSPDTGPRPGQCSNGYQTPSLHFIDKHPLMFGVIYPTFNRPIFITQTDNRVMKIAVDAEAGLSDKVMLYLGTEEGKLIKVRTRLQNINGAKAQAIEKVKLHDYECYGDGCCIRELRVARSNEGPSALIAFSSYMSRLPLANCNLKSEECCSLLPDCGWNKREDTCVQRTSINNSSLIPSLSDDDIWPTECSVATPTADQNKSVYQASTSSPIFIYFITAAIAFGLGLLIMFLFMRRRNQTGRVHKVNKGIKSRKWQSSTDEIDGKGDATPTKKSLTRPANLPRQNQDSSDYKYNLPTPSSEHENFEAFPEIKRENEKLKAYADLPTPRQSVDLTAKKTNANINNSNNSTPPLPPKLTARVPPLGSNVLPVVEHTPPPTKSKLKDVTSPTHPLLEKSISSAKKPIRQTSFGGFDGKNKPPVPVKPATLNRAQSMQIRPGTNFQPRPRHVVRYSNKRLSNKLVPAAIPLIPTSPDSNV